MFVLDTVINPWDPYVKCFFRIQPLPKFILWWIERSTTTSAGSTKGRASGQWGNWTLSQLPIHLHLPFTLVHLPHWSTVGLQCCHLHSDLIDLVELEKKSSLLVTDSLKSSQIFFCFMKPEIFYFSVIEGKKNSKFEGEKKLLVSMKQVIWHLKKNKKVIINISFWLWWMLMIDVTLNIAYAPNYSGI